MADNSKKIVIITGASGSVGKASVEAMAAKGWHVIMACRNMQKGEDVRQQILKNLPEASLELAKLEMESRDSIREFAASMEGRQIDALFNNAGIMNRHFTRTADGIEKSFAVNYLAPILLTTLLLPYMKADARVVNMVSLTTKFASLDINWQEWDEKHFGQLSTYGSSKLAFLYYSIALAKHYPQLHVNVADPGIVNSNMISMKRWYDPLADIFFRPFIKTPEQGAVPGIAALQTDEYTKYFVGKKVKAIPSRFMNNKLVDQLWEQAQGILGIEL